MRFSEGGRGRGSWKGVERGGERSYVCTDPKDTITTIITITITTIASLGHGGSGTICIKIMVTVKSGASSPRSLRPRAGTDWLLFTEYCQIISGSILTAP